MTPVPSRKHAVQKRSMGVSKAASAKQSRKGRGDLHGPCNHCGVSGEALASFAAGRHRQLHACNCHVQERISTQTTDSLFVVHPLAVVPRMISLRLPHWR